MTKRPTAPRRRVRARGDDRRRRRRRRRVQSGRGVRGSRCVRRSRRIPAGEFAREGTIVDGDEGVDAFGRVAVFRGAWVDPGENPRRDGAGRPGAVLGGARLEAQAPGGERAGDGGARAGRATPVARKDQTRARPIDDGAEVIQELGSNARGLGRGRGRVSRPSSSRCEDEPTARHGAHRIRDGETYLWVTNTPSTSRKSTFIASRNRARRCRARTIRSGTWRRGRDLRGERERRRRRQARARAFFAM